MTAISARSRRAWELAAAQDYVVTWEQLERLGFTHHAVRHRVATGRLHRLWPGVFAVGRGSVTRRGIWRAAVLACGPKACLSHHSAAALTGIRPDTSALLHVSIPAPSVRRLRGIRPHRRSNLRTFEISWIEGIPITVAATTLVDIASDLSPAQLERAVNDADKHELIDPVELRRQLDRMPPRPGKARLRRLLDRHTFLLTASELERRFIPIARRAGLPGPRTGPTVNGFEVDFFWPDIGLVVETDGLRYHRTPAAQSRDRLRDQAHAAAGMTPLRFTHAQIRYEPAHVERVLRTVAQRASVR